MTTGDNNKLQAVVFHLFYIISNCVEQNKVTLEYLIHLIIYNNRSFLEKLLIKPKPFGEEKKKTLVAFAWRGERGCHIMSSEVTSMESMSAPSHYGEVIWQVARR